MKNPTYIQVLIALLSFFIVTSSVAQIDTPEKRLTRISFLHEKIFELDNESNYIEDVTFLQIKEGRDSIAENYPSIKYLKQSEFSPEALQWSTAFENEADAYITYLEIFIRKRRL